jgi:hypothetical protein
MLPQIHNAYEGIVGDKWRQPSLPAGRHDLILAAAEKVAGIPNQALRQSSVEQTKPGRCSGGFEEKQRFPAGHANGR